MKEKAKFSKGQKVYCLFLSDMPTGRKDRQGNHIECRELVITRRFYNNQHEQWSYYVDHFSTSFLQRELSELPL
jgi:hypothetical protein